MTFTDNLPYHYKLNFQKNFNILAEDYKVLYFNTQKNANSTLKAQFVNVLDLPKTDKFPKDIHHNYNFPSALQQEVASKYSDFLKFAVIRNPWDRLASCYNNKIRQNSGTGKDYILDCSPKLFIGMPFEEFVDVICKIPDSEADFHFCSQIYLMLYPDGSFPMNYLYNIENLDFHIKEIKLKTGIPFVSLPSLNRSEKSNHTSMYTGKLIEKVAKRYQADIEFFQYSFGKINDQFTFGEIPTDWFNQVSKNPLMLSILKEKNRELNQILSLKTIPQTKEISNLKKELRVLKEELKNIENSLSWKITKPLRSFNPRKGKQTIF